MNPTNPVSQVVGVKRPSFFEGKLLTADDLNAEQEYHISKHRQLNRALLGFGIVRGLGVSCEGSRVTVTAGLAVDPLGRLVELPDDQCFDLPSSQGIWKVAIELDEVPCDPVVAYAGDGGTDRPVQYSRIQEVVKLFLVDGVKPDSGCANPRQVSLGRIRVWNGQVEVNAAPRRPTDAR